MHFTSKLDFLIDVGYLWSGGVNNTSIDSPPMMFVVDLFVNGSYGRAARNSHNIELLSIIVTVSTKLGSVSVGFYCGFNGRLRHLGD